MPQNAGYMYAAYTLITLLYAGYVVSLRVRGRRSRDRQRAVERA